MNSPTPTRWNQFNLRTWFVAFTLLCVAFGIDAYHGTWMRARRAVMRSGEVTGSSVTASNFFGRTLAPSGMWVFGAPGYSTVHVTSDEVTDERVDELRELFPEARFLLMNRGRREVLPARGY